MKHRVLLIDDDEAILDVFQILLTSHNYLVDCARDLKEVEVNLCRNLYSIVVADLSVLRGEIEELRLLDRLSRQAEKPLIVVCSGYEASDVNGSALVGQADVFLGKPFVFKALLRELDGLLNDVHPAKAIQGSDWSGPMLGLSQ